MSLRIEKVNAELRRQIMQIIQKEIDDPIVDFLSITRVETTLDLQESKVYFSMLDESKYDAAQEILDSTNSLIRVKLAKKIRLKILPKLFFKPDNSIKYSVDIYQKIEELKEEDGE